MSERIEKYVDKVFKFLKLHPMIKDVNVERRIVAKSRGYIKATVSFVNDSQLWIREFVDDKLRKIDYAYHYQSSDGKLLFRYDNAPHHAGLATFPHHKHSWNKPTPEPTKEKTLIDVVNEIVEIIRKDLFRKVGSET